eukprot:TRINITY_DN5963_c0_g1_i2.p1 TRINITY_DN5963_c0_g1~~TRINITY_DN5963_c0_g1_i2.p1  ORF type:complete len:416 (+),score=20.73 TRINITY_DN5963_c0_g1_i2:72-1319(+)
MCIRDRWYQRRVHGSPKPQVYPAITLRLAQNSVAIRNILSNLNTYIAHLLLFRVIKKDMPCAGFLECVSFQTKLTLLGNFITIWTIQYLYGLSLSLLLPLSIGILCALIMLLCRVSETLFARILYGIMCIWWAFIIYFSVCSVFFHAFNLFYQLPATLGLLAILIPTLVLVVRGFSNALQLKIKRLYLNIPKIDTSARVVHLSDLHLGPVHRHRFVEKVIAKIKRLNPDLVVITGDLFDGSMTVDPTVLKPFSELKARIFFVLGNHDAYYLGMDEVRKSLKLSNITLLENQQIDYNGINIIGMGYEFNAKGLEKQLATYETHKNRLNILLYHAPQLPIETIEKHNFNLCLSGHTHGGQIVPMFILNLGIFKYTKGLYKSQSGRSFIHMSMGTGTTGPPLRMFSRSTISVLDINFI